MKYLAHIAEDGREQTVLEHLKGTAELCGRFAAPFCSEELGRMTGLAHDIGKYSEAFQKRLHGGVIVDHSTAGAFECRRNRPVSFCIAGHHGGLPDGGGKADVGQATWWGRLNKAMAGGLEPYSAWKKEVDLSPAPLPQYSGRDWLTAAFFIRMLYSCLVDADYLDTERFMEGHEVERGGGASISELNEKLDRYIADWFPPKGELNTCRCAILEQCMNQGIVHEPGLFTLTVPTGGGKTVDSLAFALRHAREHGFQRIIYVIPYTSIIEQTADTFRKILGERNVLEHHSGVIFDTQTDGEGKPDAMRLARATENWDMPVIVTTAVQFFESLYANRSSKCRKLHNLAESVIIFDEAQMLPLSYLRPCVSAISQLVAHYHVSAVLCTATQPVLEPLFREFFPNQTAIELCPRGVYENPVFRRVTFRNAGKLLWTELTEELQNREQVLCIVNSRKNAQTVYEQLKGEGVFHLSTLMYPAHRRAVLKEIRRRLNPEHPLPCRVISTSLIEAGVDVDFPVVYRESAGLDSVLQAAGRCNREGKRSAEQSIVTVFQAEEKAPPLFWTAMKAGEAAMEAYPDISSQQAIACYFRELRDLKGTDAQDRENILKALQTDYFPFKTIADRFHLIDSSTSTIYIPLEKGADLIEQYRQGMRSRQLFRELGQYSVSVYEQHLSKLLQAGDVEQLDDESYLLINPSLYDEKTGLSMYADFGKGLWI